MATTYCSVADVADFIRVDITDTSTPNKAQVEKLILRKEAEIERRTGHAWKETIAEPEVHDLAIIYEYGWGTPIFLKHRKVRVDSNGMLVPGSGDKVEVFGGASTGGGATYQDITTTPSNQYAIEPVYGRLYLRGFIFTVMRKNRIKITYRYGDTVVPGDIADICIKMTAIELLTTSFRADAIPIGGSGGLGWADSIRMWREDIDKVISDRAEIQTVI